MVYGNNVAADPQSLRRIYHCAKAKLRVIIHRQYYERQSKAGESRVGKVKKKLKNSGKRQRNRVERLMKRKYEKQNQDQRGRK